MQREKTNKLLNVVQDQASIVKCLYDDLEHALGSLQFAAKDINDVATFLKDGNPATAANIKKLEYRSIDIENIVKEHKDWKKALESSIRSSDECLKHVKRF